MQISEVRKREMRLMFWNAVIKTINVGVPWPATCLRALPQRSLPPSPPVLAPA